MVELVLVLLVPQSIRLSLVLLWQIKKLGFPYYLLVVISSTSAIFVGAIISMIPIAYMATRENKK